MTQKKFLFIVLLFIFIVIFGVMVYGAFVFSSKPIKTPSIPIPVPTSEKIIRRVGEREGSFLIKNITPDTVEGLWFDAYPIAQPDDPGDPKTFSIGDDIGYACEGVSDKLVDIDFSGQNVTFEKVVGERPSGGCPICLAVNTFIDTPSGYVPVQDVWIGMPVWTVDKTGQRVSGVILKKSKVSAPSTHHIIHLVLNDHRELFVSPGHPTVDGRTVDDLALGDLYDNALVVGVSRIFYNERATYDILPSGETGFYWANGILLGSTLR